jgi:phospho-N-acetylmuramoyl-pentapeptide-transferase
VNEAYALPVAFLAAALPMPLAIKLLTRWGLRQSIREDVPSSHQKKAGTPTMGGAVMMAALLFTCFGLAFLWPRIGQPSIAVLALAAAYCAIGLIDDIVAVKRGRNLGLKARHKFLLQAVGAGLFIWYLASRPQISTATLVPFSSRLLELGWSYYLLAALFVIGTANATNLTDGLDGLAAGLGAISAVCMGVVAGLHREQGPALICFALAGVCLGFLWFNLYPARIFMGDTGSMVIGATLAGAAIVSKQELALLLFGLIFFVEALSVILQVASFKTTGRRIFKMSPLHHHFELCGWSETQIAGRLWLISGLVSVLTLLGMGAWRA